MNDNSPLSSKDLKRMDLLLNTRSSTLPENGQLTELDWLAIKTIDDIEQRPKRTFYNLRIFDTQIKSDQNLNSVNPLGSYLKR